MKRSRKVLSVLFAICLALALLPRTPARALNGVKYIDSDRSEKTADNVGVLTGSEYTLKAGWYVVNRDVNYTHQVTFSGYVYLILADGCTMTLHNRSNYGISSTEGCLSIYGQREGTGALNISTETVPYSAISLDKGDLTINGGNVTAVYSGNLDNSSITVYAGSITVNGGSVNTGKCRIYSGHYMYIYGGRVEAGGLIAASKHGVVYLSYREADDYIKAGSLQGYAVTVLTDRILVDEAGREYKGKLTDGQRSNAAGSTLRPKTYTVTFETNGGSAVDACRVAHGAQVKLNPVTTLPGYTIEGWYDNSELAGDAITAFPASFTGNATYYAKWTRARGTITFDTDGGSAVAPITQDYGTA
ncbi:MAG: InlB B-repeat-containing protein, partial [Oscillospiraceae bacterium]|nr:InlB B-repeat-containing protein [Oscillospiraceae bacterium]